MGQIWPAGLQAEHSSPLHTSTGTQLQISSLSTTGVDSEPRLEQAQNTGSFSTQSTAVTARRLQRDSAATGRVLRQTGSSSGVHSVRSHWGLGWV